ncbi:hypothetical protein [Nocardia sp. NPDC051570]|uniref:hypothetical protein n=1 Tax=Nocardia sp. NPDC051570 TaxID=3364324 RepID=UPI00379C65EC
MQWLNSWEAKRLTGKDLRTLYRWKERGWVTSGKRGTERMWEKQSVLHALALSKQKHGGKRNAYGGGRLADWGSDRKRESELLPLFDLTSTGNDD